MTTKIPQSKMFIYSGIMVLKTNYRDREREEKTDRERKTERGERERERGEREEREQWTT